MVVATLIVRTMDLLTTKREENRQNASVSVRIEIYVLQRTELVFAGALAVVEFVAGGDPSTAFAEYQDLGPRERPTEPRSPVARYMVVVARVKHLKKVGGS